MSSERVDLSVMVRVTATLLGLSFAAISIGFSSFQSPYLSESVKSRATFFLQYGLASAFLFLISFHSSFYAYAFTDQDSRRRRILTTISVVSLLTGTFSVTLALFALYGFRIVVTFI